MSFSYTFKTAAAAAGIALFSTVAHAATVAEITTEGAFATLSDGNTTAFGVEGGFTAFLDTGFDTTETNDFLFELDLEATGLPAIDEELFVPGITGDDIIGFALSVLFDLELAVPGAINSVIGEILDGDLDQSEIGSTGIWFGFDFDILSVGADTIGGTYAGLLSQGEFDLLDIQGISNEGAFVGTASISTVAAVPLPASFPLLALAGAGLMSLRRRRRG